MSSQNLYLDQFYFPCYCGAMMDLRLFQRIRWHLAQNGHDRITRVEGRESLIAADGLKITVKVATKGAGGWRVNIHRHGELDENGTDAYIVALENGRTHPYYLIFAAPLGRSCLRISDRSLHRQYRENVNNWGLLCSLAKRESAA
jgi:hypothetical protein